MEGSKLAAAILGEVRRAVVGKDEVLAKVLLAILAGGHILLEDIPGVGKTTMALAFSRALSLRYNRVQLTPAVMPSDITGFPLHNKEAGRMESPPGAVLCHLFLAAGPNLATRRPQSALLEAPAAGPAPVFRPGEGGWGERRGLRQAQPDGADAVGRELPNADARVA